MNGRFIYVASDGGYDHSRWLSVSLVEPGHVKLDLADLCQPGRVSALESVLLRLDDLEGSLKNGAIQVTNHEGYFILRRTQDAVHIEFRGQQETSPCRATIRYSDFLEHIAHLVRSVPEIALR